MKIENAVEFYHFKLAMLKQQLTLCVDTTLAPQSSDFLVALAATQEAALVTQIVTLRNDLAALTIDVEF